MFEDWVSKLKSMKSKRLTYSSWVPRNLYNNKLTGNIPDGIGQLRKLKSLYVEWEASIFISQSPHSLQEIVPEYADWIHSRIDRRIGRSTSLVRIIREQSIEWRLSFLRNSHRDFPFNQLTGSIPQSIGRLTNLLGLFVEARHMGSITLIFFHRKLHGNQLTGPIPPEIGGLTNIRALYE